MQIPPAAPFLPWLESEDTTDSKPVARKGVWAHIPPGGPIFKRRLAKGYARALEARARKGVRVQPPRRRPISPRSSKRTARLIPGIALDECLVWERYPPRRPTLLPCKRSQRRSWPVPRRGRRTSGAGLHFARVAQLSERVLPKDEAAGEIPALGTSFLRVPRTAQGAVF